MRIDVIKRSTKQQRPNKPERSGNWVNIRNILCALNAYLREQWAVSFVVVLFIHRGQNVYECACSLYGSFALAQRCRSAENGPFRRLYSRVYTLTTNTHALTLRRREGKKRDASGTSKTKSAGPHVSFTRFTGGSSASNSIGSFCFLLASLLLAGPLMETTYGICKKSAWPIVE